MKRLTRRQVIYGAIAVTVVLLVLLIILQAPIVTRSAWLIVPLFIGFLAYIELKTNRSAIRELRHKYARTKNLKRWLYLRRKPLLLIAQAAGATLFIALLLLVVPQSAL